VRQSLACGTAAALGRRGAAAAGVVAAGALVARASATPLARGDHEESAAIAGVVSV